MNHAATFAINAFLTTRIGTISSCMSNIRPLRARRLASEPAVVESTLTIRWEGSIAKESHGLCNRGSVQGFRFAAHGLMSLVDT
jgi:hypothetical protein